MGTRGHAISRFCGPGIIGVVVGALATICALRVGCARDALVSPVFRDDAEIAADWERFGRLAEALKTVLHESDGYLPADPYLALLEGGHIDSFHVYLFEGRAVEFLWRTAPVRLNPNIEENRRAPLFWVVHPQARQLWVCYFDGSLGRLSASLHLNAPSEFGRALREWHALYFEVGFPFWETRSQRAAWVREHKGDLAWEATLKMYVVSPPLSKPN